MAIKKASDSNIAGKRYSDASAGTSKIEDVADAPTIGTVTRTDSVTVSVPFTLASTGGNASSVDVIATPTVSDIATSSGTSSPATVTGSFIPDQAYTFSIRASSSQGYGQKGSNSNSITPFTNFNVQFLVVGGGGAGGLGNWAGGGGGGGFAEGTLTGASRNVAYNISIGGGGGGTASSGNNYGGSGSGGSSSQFDTVYGNGSGGGGNNSGAGGGGGSGGGGGGQGYGNYGGGGTNQTTSGPGWLGYGTAGSPNSGGYGRDAHGQVEYWYYGGPGGGAGRAAAINGAGYAYGGGQSYTRSYHSPTLCGGGGGSGGANSGNGGAAGNYNSKSGSGGSGVVILKYPAILSISTSGLTTSTTSSGGYKTTTVSAGSGTLTWSYP